MIYISPRELDTNLPLLDATVKKYNGKVVPEIKIRLAMELNIIDVSSYNYHNTIESQDEIIIKDTQEVYKVIRVDSEYSNWLTVTKV